MKESRCIYTLLGLFLLILTATATTSPARAATREMVSPSALGLSHVVLSVRHVPGGKGTFTEYAIPTSGSTPEEITTGPDSTLWFTEGQGNKIGKITTGSTITEYPVPTSGSDPKGITAGPDGTLWFTEYDGTRIGKITPSGTITEYPSLISGSGPQEITTGPDGNLWFTEGQGNRVGKITPSGAITEYPVPRAKLGKSLPVARSRSIRCQIAAVILLA